ncbi:MAG: efflux RND transporter periplasmic adaptor subunit [Alphaproteobacteria bacterium]|nr:efflux RND transporter periplasmic adaptor subunit [Alphaproteobacteria bacterium]
MAYDIGNLSPRLKWATGAALVLVAIGGAYAFRGGGTVTLRVAAAEKNVEVRVFGIGTVEAQVLSKVGFQTGGRIQAVHADQGDLVKAGTVLAKLDDDTQRAKVLKSEAARRQAAATLSRTQAQRQRVEATYKQKQSVNQRRQTLAGRGSVSQEAAEDAQSAEDAARGDLAVVEADAAIAAGLQDDAAAQHRFEAAVLEQHELKAPFDARVIARHKEVGSIANPGEAVFTLIAPQSIWVRAHVDESLAGGLAAGQTAYVRLRSEGNRLVETQVVRIDQENDRTTEERRIYVRCKVCDPQHPMRFLGEQAEVEIVKRVIAEGLFVPLTSVEGYDGRSGTVWAIRDGRLAKIRVNLGDRLLDGRVHVTSALPPGVSIVTDGRSDLREGRAARAAAPGG